MSGSSEAIMHAYVILIKNEVVCVYVLQCHVIKKLIVLMNAGADRQIKNGINVTLKSKYC